LLGGIYFVSNFDDKRTSSLKVSNSDFSSVNAIQGGIGYLID